LPIGAAQAQILLCLLAGVWRSYSQKLHAVLYAKQPFSVENGKEEIDFFLKCGANAAGMTGIGSGLALRG
jgi:hypothetical protein